MYSYKIKIKKTCGKVNESLEKKVSLLITSKKPLSQKSLFNKVEEYVWENYQKRVEEIVLCESISDFFPNIFDIEITGGSERQNSYGKSIMNRVLSRISYKKYYAQFRELFEEIKEKIEKMTHPSIWINNFKDARTVDEILNIFSNLDVDGEMKSHIENSRRWEASNSDFEQNWYKLETSYIKRDISEKCHGVYVKSFSEDGSRDAYGDDEYHVLLYIPKKLVKDRYVILPKNSEIFGVIYQFAKYVHNPRYENAAIFPLKKERYVGKTRISTDLIYNCYKNERDFWPRPEDMSNDYYVNRR